MNLGKGISNLFFKVEEDKTEAPAKVETPVPQAVAQFAASTSASTPAVEDAEIKKQLTAALEAANQSGYDYFEMAQSIEAQAAIIPSEALRFQSTFATVAPMGVTPEKLIDSAQYYLLILKGKEDEFNKTVEAHLAQSVTSKEKDVTQFDADMQNKSEQIKKLTEEINALQQQKTSIINEVSSNKAKIDQVKNNFNATMKVFVDRINSDIEKIKMYLKKA